MAKNHPCGPGVSEHGGVRSTMDNAVGASSSPGDGNNLKGEFGRYPHDTGGGGIPTTVYAKGIDVPKVPKPGAGGGTVPVLGGQGGQQRPGAGGKR